MIFFGKKSSLNTKVLLYMKHIFCLTAIKAYLHDKSEFKDRALTKYIGVKLNLNGLHVKFISCTKILHHAL